MSEHDDSELPRLHRHGECRDHRRSTPRSRQRLDRHRCCRLALRIRCCAAAGTRRAWAGVWLARDHLLGRDVRSGCKVRPRLRRRSGFATPVDSRGAGHRPAAAPGHRAGLRPGQQPRRRPAVLHHALRRGPHAAPRGQRLAPQSRHGGSGPVRAAGAGARLRHHLPDRGVCPCAAGHPPRPQGRQCGARRFRRGDRPRLGRGQACWAPRRRRRLGRRW